MASLNVNSLQVEASPPHRGGNNDDNELIDSAAHVDSYPRERFSGILYLYELDDRVYSDRVWWEKARSDRA